MLGAGAVRGGSDPLTPLANLSRQETHELQFVQVVGLPAFEQALKSADLDKPLMLDIYADWCVSCQVLEKRIFTQPDVSAELKDFTLVRADITANSAEDQALLQRFGLFGPPSLLFFSPSGDELQAFRIRGEVSAPDLLARLKAVLQANAAI